MLDKIGIIDSLINNTEFTSEQFTGASVIQTITHDRTVVKYKVSLYFGYVDKKPISRVLEIDKELFLLIPSALDKYIQQIKNSSKNNVLSVGNLVGNVTSNVTSNVTPTNTISNSKLLITEELFEKFWEKYPNKVSKKKAFISFKNLTRKQQKLAIDDLETRFKNTEAKYIPHPTTYINGERWEDVNLNKSNKKLWSNGI